MTTFTTPAPQDAALDRERCLGAVRSRDARFDGWFYVAVTTTRIYCRPSCPARPHERNLVFFRTAAAAHDRGFRACKRCRPDATPGSPEWNVRGDLVARAMRLIADGVVDRDGVAGLAARLGYSERQLHRVMTQELGAGPLAVARSQRATAARVLIETSPLPFTDVAFAAGFRSVRQFNATVREVFGMSPGEMRALRRAGEAAGPGTVTLRLAARAPFDAAGLLAFLAARAVPGVEGATAGGVGRVLDLPRGPAVVQLHPAGDAAGVAATLRLADWGDLAAAVERCRRWLDLDSDPVAVDGALRRDPLLAAAVRARPGLRSPGAADSAEHAFRAVAGQQVSVGAARTVLGRLVLAAGRPLPAELAEPEAGLTHAFPRPADIAALDPALFPMPRARAATLRSLAAEVAAGRLALDPGADRDEVAARMAAIRGVGPWTIAYVRMRALGDPDVFLPTDLGVRRGLEALGADGSPAAAAARAAAWRPWRSYAVHHLWNCAS